MRKKNIHDARNTCPSPKGILLLIGGGEDRGNGSTVDKEQNGEPGGIRMEVLECFIKLIPAKKPKIEVITTAGSNGVEGTFRMYQTAFNELGAGAVNHLHHESREDIKLSEIEDRLKAADGIFLTGGDQLRLTSIYGGTEFLLLLKRRYIFENLVLAGTSAGAMAMSTPMIYQGVGRDEMIAGNVKVTIGLEFIKDICVDTHFVGRGRFVRMGQVIASNPTSVGVGVEEDTAIVIRNGREGEVVGTGVVIIINGQTSRGTNITNTGELITVRGLMVDILSKGEKFELPEVNPPHK